jgi:hypothetical protein
VPDVQSPAARTELSSVIFEQGVGDLIVAGKTAVTGRLVSGTLPSSARVVASVAPTIGGQPDLQFETDWPASPEPGGSQFMLNVPTNFLGRPAVLGIVPTSMIPPSPAESTHPPFSLEVTIAAVIPVTLPTETMLVTARFFQGNTEPQDGYLVRAYQGERLISNVAETGTDGAFKLTVPAVNIANDFAQPVTVKLSPRDEDGPSYVTAPFTLTRTIDLKDLRLPAVLNPDIFRFDVKGDGGQPVSGATLRFRTVLAEDDSGSSLYARDVRTDVEGKAQVPLIPGTATEARHYDITVIPRPGSEFATKCLARFTVTRGGTYDAPQVPPTITLAPRAELSGAVTRSDGAALGGVTILASRIDDGAVAGCAEAATLPPTSVSTDKDGQYRLLVDPGTYRIDYDPPAGAPVPRFTEPSVVIESSAVRAVQLQPGVLVEGVVRAADRKAVPSVGIRFLESLCQSADSCYGPMRVAPLLRGQTRADAQGAFRVVLPVPP